MISESDMENMFDILHGFNNLLTVVICNIEMAKALVSEQASIDKTLQMLYQAEEASKQLKNSIRNITLNMNATKPITIT